MNHWSLLMINNKFQQSTYCFRCLERCHILRRSIVFGFNWFVNHILAVWHQYFWPVATHLALVALSACPAQGQAIAVKLPLWGLATTAMAHTSVVDSHIRSPCWDWPILSKRNVPTVIIQDRQHENKWFWTLQIWEMDQFELIYLTERILFLLIRLIGFVLVSY